MGNLEGINLVNLKKIPTIGGEVMHAIKSNDIGFTKFGEAYFTTIESGLVRGWKLHKRMVSNLVVPIGEIKFVLYDTRTKSKTFKNYQEIVIGENNYYRLTIPENIWFAFKGLNKSNIIFNLSSILHDPSEVLTKPLDEIKFKW